MNPNHYLIFHFCVGLLFYWKFAKEKITEGNSAFEEAVVAFCWVCFWPPLLGAGIALTLPKLKKYTERKKKC